MPNTPAPLNVDELEAVRDLRVAAAEAHLADEEYGLTSPEAELAYAEWFRAEREVLAAGVDAAIVSSGREVTNNEREALIDLAATVNEAAITVVTAGGGGVLLAVTVAIEAVKGLVENPATTWALAAAHLETVALDGPYPSIEDSPTVKASRKVVARMRPFARPRRP